MTPRRILRLTLFVGTTALGACDHDSESLAPEISAAVVHATAAPEPLVNVATPFGSFDFWPYTGTDVAGAISDPINVVFAGSADPRALRASLMFLDGDRTAFGMPDAFPFDCTWRDAIGGVQSAYGEPGGWTGSSIQLKCGDYDVVRFHVRFFEVGGYTLGGAHFEMLVPATTTHQVLSWDLAEQLLAVDLIRSGILDPALPLMPTAPINEVGHFGEILAPLYAGLPASLQAALGSPAPLPSGNYPIGTDGRAVAFNVVDPVDLQAGIAREERVIEFGQVIPKPFCMEGPLDYIHVTGPVHMRQQVTVSRSGNLVSQFKAVGQLLLTPINPLTGETGTAYRAHVNEHHKGVYTDNVNLTSLLQIQALIRPGAHERLRATLNVSPGAADFASLEIRCSE